MKKLNAILLSILIFWILCGCALETGKNDGQQEEPAHVHTWADATCTEAKHCLECGETQGKPLGHYWANATCTEPKTCKDCGLTDGDPLGHTWIEATCMEPKTCRTCKQTEGQPNGHVWIDATCGSPKICSVCGETEGEALGHDTPNLTCTSDDVCLRCGETVTAPGHTLVEATCIEPAKCSVCGEVLGEALGHTTSSGVCERCGAEVYETIKGSGDDVVALSTGDGLYRVHFTHSGRRNFIVKAYDNTGDYELLINEIGKYDGYVLLMGESPYNVEITADGGWTLLAERLTATSDTSFSGTGDYVTGLAKISSGTWELTHTGTSNFIVKLYTTNGVSLVVNEIGRYSGKKVLTIPSKSFSMFEVTADGAWEIKKVS